MKPQYELITPLDAHSFKAFKFEKDEFDAPWHYHPEYELTYILSGSGIRYVGNSFEDFAEDDLVLLGPDLPHCWKNTGRPQRSAAIVIQWKEDFMGKEWLACGEFAAIRKLLQDAGKGIRFGAGTAGMLKEKLAALVTLSPFDKVIGLLQILHTLAQTAQAEVLCEEGFPGNLNRVDNDRINIIYQYVKNHYQQKITLSVLAAQVGMTTEAFSRFFSKVMKKPFFGFLNEYRINIACKLLIETDLQVAQICYAAGYESLPFFYRQFKKCRGASPQQYRTQYRKII